jgi:hypothetical protein
VTVTCPSRDQLGCPSRVTPVTSPHTPLVHHKSASAHLLREVRAEPRGRYRDREDQLIGQLPLGMYGDLDVLPKAAHWIGNPVPGKAVSPPHQPRS